MGIIRKNSFPRFLLIRPGWNVILCIALLTWLNVSCGAGAGAPPNPVEVHSLPEATPVTSSVQPSATKYPSNATDVPVLRAIIPEDRRLVTEWPLKIRVGDSGLIRLILEMDEYGNVTPTGSVGGDQILVESVSIPNLFETHQIIAQARLDLSGMEYRPGGEISEALLPGQPVRFIWSVRPAEVGVYRGTIWLYMLFIPRSGGEETRSVISAQTVEIQAVNFLGLGGNSARIVGSIGVVLGSMIGLDNLFSLVWKWVLRKRPAKIVHTG